MDPVSVIGLVSSIITLIDTTIEVVKFFNDVNDAPKEWTAFAQEASNLLSVLTTLRYTVSSVNVDDPWFVGIRSLGGKDGPLEQFHESLTQLTSKLKPHSGGMEIKRRLLWSFDKKEINEQFLKLERLKSLINIALNRDQIGVLVTIKDDVGSVSETAIKTSNQVQDLHNHLHEKHHKEFLDWLSPLTYSAKQTDAFSRCQAGSYQWLLAMSEFQDWVSHGDKILWGCGMPGAGKTTFTSFLIEELSASATPDVRILYVYFNYKEPSQTPITIVGALVRQILEDRGDLGASLLAKYKIRKNQEKVTLTDLQRCLHESLDCYSKSFVLFDAFDEYDEGVGDRSQLVEELFKLSKRSGTHVMVTSRWLASLQRDLSGSSYIEIRASDLDVEAYVRDQIRSSARLRSHIRQDDSLEEDILQAVKASCQGMFLLAKLHMDSLSTKANRRSIRQALLSLPKKLEDTYLLVFERIENQNEDDTNLAFQLLTWLTYSQRPLTVKEIQHAMAVNIGDDHLDVDDFVDQEILLSVCAGIVSIEKRSNIIRLIHYTTEEYLRGIRGTHPMLSSGQKHITKVCTSYLSSADFEKGVRFEKYLFYKYAASFWAEHAKQGGEEDSQKEILKYLTHDGKASAPASRHERDSPNEFPLRYGVHHSARFGLTVTLENLLAMGADALRYDSWGKTALHYACQNQHEAVVSLLLDQQDVAKKSQAVWFALELAASYNSNQVMEMIFSKYSDHLTNKDSLGRQHFGRTPLHRAVSVGDTLIGPMLSKVPFLVDIPDKFGMTALHHAALRGDEKAAETLLLNGASPNRLDEYQGTPLLYTVYNQKWPLVELLAKHGATERMSPSSSSLLYAAAAGQTESLDRLLVHYPTSINEPDDTGWAALHFATASRNMESVRLLLGRGADSTLRSHEGLTPRDIAISNRISELDVFENYGLSSGVSVSGSHGAQSPNESSGTTSLQEDAVSALGDLILESTDIVDYQTLLDLMEMDADDDYERFSQSILISYVFSIKRGFLDLEQSLFLGDMLGISIAKELFGSNAEMVGLGKSSGLWKEISDTAWDLRLRKTHFDDATASKLEGLVSGIFEIHNREREFVDKLGKLPYGMVDQIRQLTGIEDDPTEALANSLRF